MSYLQHLKIIKRKKNFNLSYHFVCFCSPGISWKSFWTITQLLHTSLSNWLDLEENQGCVREAFAQTGLRKSHSETVSTYWNLDWEITCCLWFIKLNYHFEISTICVEFLRWFRSPDSGWFEFELSSLHFLSNPIKL